jgi:DNA-binding CsgD family transcriptional regulator
MPLSERPISLIDADAACAALEHLEAAVLLLAADGHVVYMNEAAAEMIAANDGLDLASNRLQAAKSDASREMASQIHDAASHRDGRGGTVVLPRPSNRRPLIARIYPVLGRGRLVPPEGARVVVFIIDPELRAQRPVSSVAQVYHLARAEARLLARLIDSPTLLAAANALDITEATARTLLGRIFIKTGTSRQPELVRLVFTTRPPVRPE